LFLLVPVYGLLGLATDRTDRPWFARPAFVAGALMLILALDLLAVKGKMFEHLGISVVPLQNAEVKGTDLELPAWLALSLNGAMFYVVATSLERYGSFAMAAAAQFLFVIAPFSILEPLAEISGWELSVARFDWLYLSMAVLVAMISRWRQRKSFYYAGLLNAGLALFFIADHRDWYSKLWWGRTLIIIGLAGLVAGFVFATRRQRHT
jgi:hypothetical protein